MITVEVSNLTKIYESSYKKRRITALTNFNLNVEEGTVFGLLGPNGAGKTTLVKVLLGIVYPTLGSAKILGQNINNYAIRKRVGYLPENHKFPPYLNGEDVLKYVGRISGCTNYEINSRIDSLLKLVKMEKWKRTKVKKYSKGMMQRLGLAQALINNPDLIFLDEPTDGVDPIGRKEIRDILLNLKKEGKTIFINSHLLSEVELISDRVAILNNGLLIKEGTVEDLTTNKETYSIKLTGDIDKLWIEENFRAFHINNITANSFEAKVSNETELNSLIDELRKAGKNIKEVVPVKTSLEDMFISLINESDKKKTNE
ncbi:abc transporter, atp-binding protein [hydrocarbon metagenome]|uniref:Abc transporter, atp-binding protein n=1 Tax=hydrocarbon metagenome TaxID=938273 RepID=A0A0W8FXM4_9ZZZZ